MRCRSFVLILFVFAPSFASGFEPAPPPSSKQVDPVLSEAQREEKIALLHKKITELMRLRREIKQLCEVLNEEQQIGLDLQVIEVNETKLRKLGFDRASFKKRSTKDSSGNDSGFYAALCESDLARATAEPKIMTLQGEPASLQLDDEARNRLSFECTPSTLESGKIRLAVKFEITRISGEDLGESVRGETTAEVEPDTSCSIAGDSITRTKANGDKEEIRVVFVVKPYFPKR